MVKYFYLGHYLELQTQKISIYSNYSEKTSPVKQKGTDKANQGDPSSDGISIGSTGN